MTPYIVEITEPNNCIRFCFHELSDILTLSVSKDISPFFSLNVCIIFDFFDSILVIPNLKTKNNTIDMVKGNTFC